ncbi:MAG: type II toxin-antitoxin system antitoxin, RelB/DinJ family [Coprobacillus sp.]|nr:type II toxin-antitoxin system antitoxin, RelB/DinJ family [Coprobacillus sp.]
MAKTATICIKMDPTLKEEGDAILKDLGMSISTFITMSFRQLVEKRGVSFELNAKKERKEPLDASKLTREELIEEIKKGYKDIDGGRTISAEEVFERLKKEYNL